MPFQLLHKRYTQAGPEAVGRRLEGRKMDDGGQTDYRLSTTKRTEEKRRFRGRG